jgi:CheY-like chemotaxis protein
MTQLSRILLAEDDPRDLELTLAALADHGLANEVIVARDGEETLDYLFRRGAHASRSDGNPVVLLLDLKMPKVDGLEALRQLRADERTRTLPVVVLTSSREPRDLEQCYRLGVNAFVVKPVQFEEFMEAVKQIGMFWALLNEPPPGSIRKR